MDKDKPIDGLWQVLRFPAARILLAFASLFLAVSTAQFVVRSFLFGDTILIRVLSTGIVVLAACLTYAAFVHVVEKRPVTELAASGAVTELASGALLGASLFTITVGILWLLGYYQVSGTNGWVVIVPAFTSAIFAAVVEEILFRGVLFRITEESLGTWLAILISALLFGLLHLFNPSATLVAAVAIVLEAGVLLAAAYVLTRRLWLAIGVHFAWNFVRGGIFGIEVSGNPGLLQATLAGPELLSGGEYGAEASVVAVLVCLAASVYLLRRTVRRDGFVRPSWKRGV